MPPAAKNAEALLQELFSRSRRQVRITDVLGEGPSRDLHSYLLPTVEPHPTPDQLRPEMLQGWRPPASLGDLSQQSIFPLLEKDTSPCPIWASQAATWGQRPLFFHLPLSEESHSTTFVTALQAVSRSPFSLSFTRLNQRSSSSRLLSTLKALHWLVPSFLTQVNGCLTSCNLSIFNVSISERLTRKATLWWMISPRP